MQYLRDDLVAAARSDATVLIVGESGAGKEFVARLVHEMGRRRSENFVRAECAAIPDSLFESELFGHVRGGFPGAYHDKPGLATAANHGTLFLNGLGEMSLGTQVLLFDFLETGAARRVGSDQVDGPFDVRVMAATTLSLHALVERGDFREDLYYRLNVLQIVIPPLRERGDDVALLLRHYLAESARAYGVAEPRLSPAAYDMLLGYRWPGNVRELKHVVESMVAGHHPNRDIVPDDLPRELLTVWPEAPQ
jgi:two-component system response regulator PilR (NtrC family)